MNGNGYMINNFPLITVSFKFVAAVLKLTKPSVVIY